MDTVQDSCPTWVTIVRTVLVPDANAWRETATIASPVFKLLTCPLVERRFITRNTSIFRLRDDSENVIAVFGDRTAAQNIIRP